MIYVTQLIYIKPGQENAFDKFEEVAIPLITKYKGTLLWRIRPDIAAFIEGEDKPPYEIHLVSFPDESDFEAFLKNPERASLLPLKEAAVERISMIKGQAL